MSFLATVVCDECMEGTPYRNVQVGTLAELEPAIAAAVLSLHADKPHVAHRIKVHRYAELPYPDEGILVLRCAVPSCRERDATLAELTTRCPLALVPAIALVFHSGHEGHAFELLWNGQRWVTPQR